MLLLSGCRTAYSAKQRCKCIFGPVPPLSNWSLALTMCFRPPQLSQLRYAAVEFVSITTPDSLNRVRLGSESAVCVLPHRPSLPVLGTTGVGPYCASQNQHSAKIGSVPVPSNCLM